MISFLFDTLSCCGVALSCARLWSMNFYREIQFCGRSGFDSVADVRPVLFVCMWRCVCVFFVILVWIKHTRLSTFFIYTCMFLWSGRICLFWSSLLRMFLEEGKRVCGWVKFKETFVKLSYYVDLATYPKGFSLRYFESWNEDKSSVFFSLFFLFFQNDCNHCWPSWSLMPN